METLQIFFVPSNLDLVLNAGMIRGVRQFLGLLGLLYATEENTNESGMKECVPKSAASPSCLPGKLLVRS